MTRLAVAIASLATVIVIVLAAGLDKPKDARLNEFTEETSKAEMSCGRNETVAPCARLCEPLCIFRIPLCQNMTCGDLFKGCRCKDGFFRTLRGKCVLAHDCPRLWRRNTVDQE